MSGINKVIIVGNLGKDPEVKFMPSGGAVANITVATSESWKDKQTGEQKEKTEWHRIVIFGKLAEIAGEYLKKGSKAYFEGQLQTRKWQDQQGQDRYTTEIVVQGFNGVMQMLDSRSQTTVQHSQQQNLQQGSQHPSQQMQPQQQQQGGFNQQQIQQQPRQQNHAGVNQVQQSPQQWQQQQQGGFQQQPQQTAQKVNPQKPSIDFDDDIPF